MSDFSTDVINMSRFGFNRLSESGDDGDGSSAIGFNRHSKLMSPATKALVLKSRTTEIEAFAEDRGYKPGIIMGIAEAVMRLGRVPSLTQYGFSGDDAKAIKHFMAGEILNLAIENSPSPTGTPIEEGTVSGGMGGQMSLASRTFMTRGNMLGMSEYAKVADEQKELGLMPRVGCDPYHKSAMTMEDIAALGQQQESLQEARGGGTYGGSHPVERLVSLLKHSKNRYMTAQSLEQEMGGPAGLKMAVKQGLKARRIVKRGKGYKLVLKEGLDGKAKEGTALSKTLRGKGKKITSPAERVPGEFEHASGGTAGPAMTTSTKVSRRIREDDEVRWVPGQGLVVEGKTRKQKSAENKARFAKLSPEAKAATKGNAPFHPEAGK